jgi:hypothetical protein
MTGITGGFLWTQEWTCGINKKAAILLIAWIIISFVRLHSVEARRQTSGHPDSISLHTFLMQFLSIFFPFRHDKINNLMNSSCCPCVYVCSHCNVGFREVLWTRHAVPVYMCVPIVTLASGKSLWTLRQHHASYLQTSEMGEVLAAFNLGSWNDVEFTIIDHGRICWVVFDRICNRSMTAFEDFPSLSVWWR